MFAALQAPLLFGLIAAAVTTFGLFMVALRGDWSERYSGLFALAAAGLLTTMAFAHLLPEAFALSLNASKWLVAGFFGGLVLNYLVRVLFPEREGSTVPTEAITPIVAIAIHSFIDGIVYSVTFAASFESGVSASLGLILHEFPEGVIAFAILRRHGVSTRNSFMWAFLAAAATTPLGVLVSGPFVYGLGEPVLGALFALSAGLLIYVATGPLMAPLRETPPIRGLSALAVGASIAIGLMLLPFHSHDHDHQHIDPHAGHNHD